jgi:hypothetical protein
MSQYLFSFGICDPCVLLELEYRLLDSAYSLEARRNQKEHFRGLKCLAHEYRTCPVFHHYVDFIYSSF